MKNLKKTCCDINTNQSYVFTNTPDASTHQFLMCCSSCGCFSCTPNYVTNRNNYPKFLLAYTVSGKGYLNYKGTTRSLMAGDLFIINCTEQHCYWSDDYAPWFFKWIHFSGGNTAWYYNFFLNQSSPVMHLANNTIVSKHIETIFQLMQYDLSPIKDMLLNQQLIHIFTHLLTSNDISALPLVDSLSHDDRIANAVAYIKIHYFESITVETLANTCNLSRYHFSRVFKSIMHTSPHEYILRYRITMAKHLLLSTNKPIETIACETGFSDSSHFIKTFKFYESITPATYKNIHISTY